MVSGMTTAQAHWSKDGAKAEKVMTVSATSPSAASPSASDSSASPSAASQGPPLFSSGLPRVASSGRPLPSSKGLSFGPTNGLGRRDYRLIDCLQQPHPELDGLYESVDEAMADAIDWLESMGPGAGETSIGLEVSTPCGSWRTIRQPDLLLCPLPSQRACH